MKHVISLCLAAMLLVSCKAEAPVTNDTVDPEVNSGISATTEENSTSAVSEEENEEITSEVDTQEEDILEDNEDSETASTEDVPAEIVEESDSASVLDLTTVEFEGNGTEPFWGFTASGSNLIMSQPSASGPMLSTTYSGVSMAYSGTLINVTGSGVSLELTPSICSNGMSETLYDYSAVMNVAGTVYYGCADAS